MKRMQQLGSQLSNNSNETMSSTLRLNENGIPAFESLPLGKDDPRYSAWGLYGAKDELGTLNRLTDERVAAAARSEIRTGARYGCQTCHMSSCAMVTASHSRHQTP